MRSKFLHKIRRWLIPYCRTYNQWRFINDCGLECALVRNVGGEVEVF